MNNKLFIKNKYYKWYFNIIEKAVVRINHETEYYEKHHIIPKCFGGDNTNDNIVKLTAKEHFICHWLLIKMCSTPQDKCKMSLALHMFRKPTNKNDRKKLTSIEFDAVRRNFSINQIGKKHTLQHRQNISKGNIGKKQSNETIQKLKNIWDEEKRKTHGAMLKAKNTKYSIETMEKIARTKKQLNSHCKYMYTIMDESGNEHSTKSLKDFCRMNKISRSSFGRTLESLKFYKGFKLIGKTLL